MSQLPTFYQDFIHKSRYARWLDDEQRRETWEETVTRYIDFLEEHVASDYPQALEKFQGVKKELFDGILNLEAMPSMRLLMTAGKACARDHMASYNCLGGDTLVTTKEYGIVPIREMAGKEVHVVDGNGDWVLSSCRSFGVQETKEVRLGTSGSGSFSVRATGNHRWILKDGTLKTTDDLAPGDRFQHVHIPSAMPVDEASKDYQQGVVHGVVYGDGTSLHKQSTGSCSRSVRVQKICQGFVVRLCGAKADLLPYFREYPVSYPRSFNGDPVIYLFKGCALDLKSLPLVSTHMFNDAYLVGFLRGWLAADGTVTKAGQVGLSTTREGLDWVYENGPRLGFVPSSCRKYPDETNVGTRSEALYNVNLDRRYLHGSNILLETKRGRYKSIDKSKSPGFGKVVEIVETGKREEVFCFSVPTTQSFLLTKNLLTGNCSFLPINSPRAFDEVMYILMCGTGVGFSVERQEIAKLPTISEEMHPTDTVLVVADSKIGWASAYKELISLLYSGLIPKFDFSRVRPAGEKLKTFGGRSSGPEPLKELFEFTVNIFTKAKGRQLTSIECHDLVCKIGEIVVVGGVRRCLRQSALVSTDHGLVPISDIQVGDKVLSHAGTYKRVTGKERVGRKSLVRIDTQIGPLYSTPEHRWAVLSDLFGNVKWKEAQNLSSTDFLVHENVAIPGDANSVVSRNKVSDLAVPCSVLRGSETDRAKFIAKQFDAHGDYSKKLISTSVSEDYMLQLRAVLASLGILSKVKTVSSTQGANLQGLFLVGYTSVVSFANKVGCFSEKINKLGPCVPLSEHGSFVVPPPLVPEYYKKTNSVSWKIYERDFGKQTFIPVKVEKVADSGMQDICYDISVEDTECFVADGILTHNSATLSLSNLSDDRMRTAKSGQWWFDNPQRALANNSACFTEKPDIGVFMKEWSSLYESKSGERGIFSRKAAQRQAWKNRKRGKDILEKHNLTSPVGVKSIPELQYGVNPCAEIILRPCQTCNLTEVVVRESDEEADILRKARLATILGTLQSTFTNFRYVRKLWKKNAEDERLLGVSLTGIMDNIFYSGKIPDLDSELKFSLSYIKQACIKVNEEWADALGINRSAAITTNKPSGTVSQLVDCSSGIHARFSDYYIRSVRADVKDPLAVFMQEKGFPCEPAEGNPNVMVFYFPIKSPSKSVKVKELSALDQLRVWKLYQDAWCEHKPSCTVYYTDEEFLDVGSWVYKNFDEISGISFLPQSDHIYKQAPYTPCSEEQYESALAKMPSDISWEELAEFEKEDCTTGAQELACTGGICELVDLTRE